MLKKTFEKSSKKDENSLDIMKLSFDLVQNIDQEESFPFYTQENKKQVYHGRSKLMCETDVHLNENFSLRMKEEKIDSDA